MSLIKTDPMYKDYTLEDLLMYSSNEKIQDAIFGITMEIRELLDKGYSQKEIKELIEKIKFSESDNFNEEEQNFIKKDAIKKLKLIKENKNKERGYDIYE